MLRVEAARSYAVDCATMNLKEESVPCTGGDSDCIKVSGHHENKFRPIEQTCQICEVICQATKMVELIINVKVTAKQVAIL